MTLAVNLSNTITAALHPTGDFAYRVDHHHHLPGLQEWQYVRLQQQLLSGPVAHNQDGAMYTKALMVQRVLQDT